MQPAWVTEFMTAGGTSPTGAVAYISGVTGAGDAAGQIVVTAASALRSRLNVQPMERFQQ